MTASSNVQAASPHAHTAASTSTTGCGNGGSAAVTRPSSRGHQEVSRNNSLVDGEVVGDYVLGEVIGKGTFGKVRLGLHLLTGEKVAVKILEKKKIVEIADVERVSREIKILKRNRHMNIIQLFEVIDSPERIFLIMEFVDAGEMFDYIVSHRRIRENEAVVFFQQIVDGLDYLHANEVTHRDLKPENLLLQSHPRGHIVKIVDFGLSNTHDGGRLLRTACGSPCYAAPEMIEGKLYVGPLADIWSLGVILFAMVCGYLPFEDNNTSVLYKKILSADYTLPTFISSNVQDLIRKILETNPEKRYNTAMIRQHPWYNSVRPPIPKTLLQREDSTVHQQVMAQIHQLGQDPTRVIEAIKNKQFNKHSATYYLLYNKIVHNMKEQKPQRILQATGSATTQTQDVKLKPDAVPNQRVPSPRAAPFASGARLEVTAPSNATVKSPSAHIPHIPVVDPADKNCVTASRPPSRPNSNSTKGGRHLVICAAPISQGAPKVAAPSNQPVNVPISGISAIGASKQQTTLVAQPPSGGGSFKGTVPTSQLPAPTSPGGRRQSEPNALCDLTPKPPTERKVTVYDAASSGSHHHAPVRLAPFTHTVKDNHPNRPEMPPVAVMSYHVGKSSHGIVAPQRSTLSRRTLAFDTSGHGDPRKHQPHQPKQDDARAAAMVSAAKEPHHMLHELQNQAHAHDTCASTSAGSHMTTAAVGKAMNALLQKRASVAATSTIVERTRKIRSNPVAALSSFTPVL